MQDAVPTVPRRGLPLFSAAPPACSRSTTVLREDAAGLSPQGLSCGDDGSTRCRHAMHALPVFESNSSQDKPLRLRHAETKKLAPDVPPTHTNKHGRHHAALLVATLGIRTSADTPSQPAHADKQHSIKISLYFPGIQTTSNSNTPALSALSHADWEASRLPPQSASFRQGNSHRSAAE